MVALGVVRTPSDADPGERLLYLEEQLTGWLERFQPERVAIERVFADVNVASVMTTAHASAVAILVAARAGLPVAFHTPTEVKAAVTGSGRAGKAQVTSMVQRILGLADPPRPADAADALALAVCHAWRGVSTDRLLGLAEQQRTPHRESSSPAEPMRAVVSS